MAEEPEQPVVAGPVGPRVLLMVDDESLERFGAITKHIVVGLADVAVRVTVVSRTTRPPSALELGPCEVVHDPPKRWELRHQLPASVVELARDGKIDMVHCLSVGLLERAVRHPELARFRLAAHITDAVDLAGWAAVGAIRPRIWALPATPTLFKGVLDSKNVRSRFVRLMRLGVIGKSGVPIAAAQDHIPSAILMTPLTDDCGLDGVLRAMHVVAAGHREIVLFVLGQGPAERRFRHLSQELGLQSAVVFVGDLSQWVEAMLGCDILLVPRPPARWSSHVLEAMAAGRVILASRDNPEDHLVDEQTACLFDPTDAEDLSRQWSRLIADPQAAQQLGEAARHFVKSHHGPSAMADAIVELYAQAMAQ